MDSKIKNDYCTLYIVRHAQSESNAAGYIGAPSTDITQTGTLQSRELAQKLRTIHFDAIFSSAYVRAQKTAQIVAEERKIAVLTKELLGERRWGPVEGKKREELSQEIQKLFAMFQSLTEKEKWSWKAVPDMESAEEAVSRFITVLREIAVAYPGKTVLIVSHGTVMRSLLIHLGWGTFDELPSATIDNTGYIKVESDGVDFFVKETHGVHKKVI